MAYTQFSENTYRAIAQSIITDVIQKKEWRSVVVISNNPISFFIQKPTITTLFPLHKPALNTDLFETEPYTWYQDPLTLFSHYVPLLLQIHIEKLMFESLIAEQAARFISMDSATHNADKLLNTTRLEYNKLRQTFITKEVIELSSTF
jgi:F-type H+-transporting ATPase subunit gamma